MKDFIYHRSGGYFHNANTPKKRAHVEAVQGPRVSDRRSARKGRAKTRGNLQQPVEAARPTGRRHGKDMDRG